MASGRCTFASPSRLRRQKAGGTHRAMRMHSVCFNEGIYGPTQRNDFQRPQEGLPHDRGTTGRYEPPGTMTDEDCAFLVIAKLEGRLRQSVHYPTYKWGVRGYNGTWYSAATDRAALLLLKRYDHYDP
jgi:hypothetical protein